MMPAQQWWLCFRRDLMDRDIRVMSDAQWALALRLAATRRIRPWQAARQVAGI